MFLNWDPDQYIDWVDPVTAEVVPMDSLQQVLMSHCAKEPDFLTDHTTLVDGVFRVLLSTGNIPHRPRNWEQNWENSRTPFLRQYRAVGFIRESDRYWDKISRAGLEGMSNLYAPVAQWIEHQPSKLLVVGSNPARGARNTIYNMNIFILKKFTNQGGLKNENERYGLIKFGGKEATVVGNDLKAGDKAPDFTVLKQDWSVVKALKDTKRKVRIIASMPSLETSVCDRETRRFNEEASKLGKNIVDYGGQRRFTLYTKTLVRSCGS